MKVFPEKLDQLVLLDLGDTLVLLDLLAPLVKMEIRVISDLLESVVQRVTMAQWDLLVLKDLSDCRELLAHQDLLENLEPLVFKVHLVARVVKVLVD